MAGKITQLKKPLVRAIRDRSLVIRLDLSGISLRGRYKRVWHAMTWEELLGVADESDRPILKAISERHGSRRMAVAGISARS